MGSEPESEAKCPECGGELGPSSVSRGHILSALCLSCGYEFDGTLCPAFERPSLWRIHIHWRGKGPTLKEAALLRQFLPLHAHHSIQQVRDMYASSMDWTARMLSTHAMHELREAAEARGFQVEAEEEEKTVSRLRLPPSPATFYGARFSPSFHEKGLIAATFGESGGTVTITSEHSATTRETVAIPTGRGLRFLDEIAALDPLGIPDAWELGLDGMTAECLIRQKGGVRKFHAWSPDSQRFPRQHGFLLALHRLALDLSREPALIGFLEDLHEYLQIGLSVSVKGR
jgi:hypothetical protein